MLGLVGCKWVITSVVLASSFGDTRRFLVFYFLYFSFWVGVFFFFLIQFFGTSMISIAYRLKICTIGVNTGMSKLKLGKITTQILVLGLGLLVLMCMFPIRKTECWMGKSQTTRKKASI